MTSVTIIAVVSTQGDHLPLLLGQFIASLLFFCSLQLQQTSRGLGSTPSPLRSGCPPSYLSDSTNPDIQTIALQHNLQRLQLKHSSDSPPNLRKIHSPTGRPSPPPSMTLPAHPEEPGSESPTEKSLHKNIEERLQNTGSPHSCHGSVGSGLLGHSPPHIDGNHLGIDRYDPGRRGSGVVLLRLIRENGVWIPYTPITVLETI